MSEAPVATARVAVLGEMSAFVGNVPVDLGGPRQRAVLALLALARGEVVSAERLVAALWPTGRPGDPAASLQSFVSRLRRALQPGASARDRNALIVSAATGYALRLPTDAVDAWHFEQLVSDGTAALARNPARAAQLLTEALALWRGAALAEYADEPWAEPEIARLAELRAVAREQLAAARLALGDAAVLVPDLESLVADDPLREERWRLLVLALYRAHRQADALAALRRARAVLADELGVDPGPALRRLEQEVLAHSPALQPGPPAVPEASTESTDRGAPSDPRGSPGVPVPASPLAAADPLVERQRETALLDGCLQAVRAGTGAFAVVEGPAGIGKSRLLVEARRRAAERGATVLTARASQLEQEFSFGVARQLFEPLVLGAGGEALLSGAAAAAAPVFDVAPGGGAGAGSGDDASFAMLHGLFWLTVTLAARGPLVLVVDDIHWCDTGSLRFLAYLARRLEGVTVGLVLAYRTGERHPLGSLIDELRHDVGTVTVRPVPLTRQAVGRMIAERLGAQPDEEFVDACFDGTTGNPLLVRQLLRGLEADGVRPNRAHADVARALGSRAVSSMVLLRLRRLPAPASALAHALAVLGDGAAVPHVAELAGVDEAAAGGLTALLVGAEIVRPEPPLGFVHPLVRDGVYGDIAPGERELLHEAAARLLERSGRSAEQVAAQLLQAPRRGDGWVVRVLRDAARDAMGRGSADGAVTYLIRALAEPPVAADRADVLLELGLVETVTDGPAAGRELQAAYELLSDDQRRATAALALTRTLVFVGELGSPVRFAERALAALPTELAEERAAVQAYQRIGGQMHSVDARLWNFETEPPVPGDGYGSRMLQAALAYDVMGRSAPRADAVALAATSLADGQLVAADPGLLWVWSQVVLDLADEDVLPMWDTINSVAHRRGSLFSVLAVGFWRAWSLWRRGELTEAEQSIRTGMEQLDMWQRNASTVSYGHAVLARILHDQGRADEARAVAGDSATPPTLIDGDRLLVEVDAELLLAAGRPADALRRLELVTRRVPQVTNPAWRGDRLLWCLAAAQCGRGAEADAEAVRLLELARQWGAPSTVGEALLVLGRLRGAAGVTELREAVDVLAASPRRLLHADALLALAAGCADHDEACADDALEQAYAIGVATGAHRITAAVAAQFATRDRPLPAVTAKARSRLTSTERRIVELVDAGSTVHEIGEQLFLTPSTVQRHLDDARRRLRQAD